MPDGASLRDVLSDEPGAAARAAASWAADTGVVGVGSTAGCGAGGPEGRGGGGSGRPGGG
nr:hypothetical protein [Actinomycetospora chiangmaiensis]